MYKLSPYNTQTLLFAILTLAPGMGFLVYKKWENPLWAIGVVIIVAVIEYITVGYSLSRKERREQQKRDK